MSIICWNALQQMTRIMFPGLQTLLQTEEQLWCSAIITVIDKTIKPKLKDVVLVIYTSYNVFFYLKFLKASTRFSIGGCVEKRFAIYEKETYPLLEKYRSLGVRVETIDSSEKEKTLAAVLKVLNEYHY